LTAEFISNETKLVSRIEFLENKLKQYAYLDEYSSGEEFSL